MKKRKKSIMRLVVIAYRRRKRVIVITYRRRKNQEENSVNKDKMLWRCLALLFSLSRHRLIFLYRTAPSTLGQFVLQRLPLRTNKNTVNQSFHQSGTGAIGLQCRLLGFRQGLRHYTYFTKVVGKFFKD